MIIEGLLSLLLTLLSALLLPFRMIAFPASVANVVLQLIGYLGTGARVMKYYTHWSYISGLLAFIISMQAFVSGYHLVMWVLKKIPFLNIK